MLKRLLQYKDFCKENLEASFLAEENWITIQNIVTVLAPVYAATIQLQESQLLFGDFYKLWVNLKIQITIINTSASENLLKFLEIREFQILNNDIINAATFLDPRLKCLLSSEQKSKAKKHLKNLAIRMLSLNKVCIERKMKIGSFFILSAVNVFIKFM